MLITALYVLLILCTLALVVAAGACWLHVRKHMQHPAPSDTMKHVALEEAAGESKAQEP